MTRTVDIERAVDVGAMAAYECGELSEDGVLALFQSLVNSGLAWQLQGHYGRTAMALLEAGVIDWPERHRP